MLQAFLVLPALALVYLVAANTGVLKRLGHLLVAFGSMVLAAGWVISLVSLWPASSRPYIGGSQANSILELTLGYNGFGRLTGNEVGSVGGGGGDGGLGGGDGPRAGPCARGAGARWAGCCRPHCSCSWRGCGSPVGPRGPTWSGRAWWSGAGGWSSPPRPSASSRGSSARATKCGAAPPDA